LRHFGILLTLSSLSLGLLPEVKAQTSQPLPACPAEVFMCAGFGMEARDPANPEIRRVRVQNKCTTAVVARLVTRGGMYQGRAEPGEVTIISASGQFLGITFFSASDEQQVTQQCEAALQQKAGLTPQNQVHAQQCSPTFEFTHGGYGDTFRYTYAGGEITGRNVTINGPSQVYGRGENALRHFANEWGSEKRGARDWAECHLGQSGGKSDDGSDIDTVTPPVPGCPKYLKKSNIQWRRVGNPQLNLWEVRNVSTKTVKFTFRESGANSSPDTLPPGQSTQVSTQSSTVPPYIVRDFKEMMDFDRIQPQQKSLQCALAIRPQ